MYQWHAQDRYRRRLEAETALMLAHFPSANLVVANDGTLVWQFVVRTLRGTPFTVALAYPADFPAGEIQAFVLAPELPRGCPHQFKTGALCLGHSATSQSTAITVATWCAAWLSAMQIWNITGEWPEFDR